MEKSKKIKKTKIVCTLGPATDDDKVLRSMIDAGMDIARINFSHGIYAEHKLRIDQLKRIRSELNKPVPIMLDTSGPEIRLKTFVGGSATIEAGQPFILTTDDVAGDHTRVSVTYTGLPEDVTIGTRVMIDDGNAELRVKRIDGPDIICDVIYGATLKDRKSVNLPDIEVSMPYISEKDTEDLKFGILNGVDFIAASFTRTPNDVLDVRRVLERNGGNGVKIIAKIENRQGVNNIDDILRVADGIMVARGDLGVEIPLEELPPIQKYLIKKAYSSGRMVITATQMLESMVDSPRPTRAEANDVANAVYDGTSAVMLSGETAVGAYPAKTVEIMSRILLSAESVIDYSKQLGDFDSSDRNVTDAISHATCTTAHDLMASAIVTVTKTGSTARMISKFRPASPIISCTTDEQTCRQLNLSWGVIPIMAEEKETTDALFEHAVDRALSTGIVKKGDLVVITAGVPVGVSGTTNIIKVDIAGDMLVAGFGNGVMTECFGKACVCKNEDEAQKNFKDGDILVIPFTTNKSLQLMKKAKGIITEETGVTSHAALVGLTLEIPVITSARSATDIIKNGTIITIDSAQGMVYSGITRVY